MFLHTLKKVFLRAACGVALGFVAVSAAAAEVVERQLVVALFSYQDRAIFDVKVGAEKIGSAGKFFPLSKPRLKIGVLLAEGPQPITWMVAAEGSGVQAVKARNTPALSGLTADTRFLGVHIYPDNSVEFTLSAGYPVYTDRGKAISDQAQRANAQQRENAQ